MEVGANGASIVDVDAHLLFSGTFHRHNDDLTLSRAFDSLTIPGYFRGGDHPTLRAANGASLDGKVVAALADGHDHIMGVAANGAVPEAAEAKPLGRVESVTGDATAIRSGVSISLHAGDAVYEGDALATGEGTLAVTFLDGTAFNLSANARMVLNEMLYEPGGSSNHSLLSLVQGSINFVAGDVAHTGDMKVDTPVATMGIRGTAVHVEITADHGPTRFTVMREPSGRVGRYVLYEHEHPTSILATVGDVGTAVTVRYDGDTPIATANPKSQGDLAHEQAFVHDVFQSFQLGQQHPFLKAVQSASPRHGHHSHGSSAAMHAEAAAHASAMASLASEAHAMAAPQRGFAGPTGSEDGNDASTSALLAATLSEVRTVALLDAAEHRAPTVVASAPAAIDDPVPASVVTVPSTSTVIASAPATGTAIPPLAIPPPAAATTAVSVGDDANGAATASAPVSSMTPMNLMPVGAPLTPTAAAAAAAPTIAYAAASVTEAGATGVAGATAAATLADPDGDPVTVLTTGWTLGADGSYGKAGAYGTATLNPATGAVSYALDPGAAGPAHGAAASDGFAVSVGDGQGATATGTAVFTVRGADAAPVGTNVLLTGHGGTAQNEVPFTFADVGAVTIAAATVLSGFSDPDSDALKVVSVGPSRFGATATLNANGSLTYDAA